MLPDTGFLVSVFGEALDVDLRFDIESRDGHAEDTNAPRPDRIQMESTRLGRRALRALRTEVEGCAHVDDLEFPNPRYSLSHSRDIAVAVGDATKSLRGIGIDLEIDRSLRPQASRSFLTSREQRCLQESDTTLRSQDLLRLWCIKEAVFKANPDNRGTLLGDHELVDPTLACGAAHTREGRLVQYASWREVHACVAVAVYR